jgi:hypothetical protein
MKRKPEVISLLRKFSVYLFFDKSNGKKARDFFKKINENKDIQKTSIIQRSDLIIFFFTNKYIESDFKIDWKKKENKIFFIVLLEDIEQIPSLDLSDAVKFNLYDSIDSNEIKRFQIFLSRLIDFKSIKSSQVVMIERSMLNSKHFGHKFYTNFRNFVQKLEFIGKDKVIVKTCEDKTKYEIVIIDWIEGKIISKIKIEDKYNLDFCWIEHLNQLLVYQDCDKVKKFLLFTINGDFVKEVFSENTIEHIVSAISYNRDKFEVYLNAYDKISSSGYILILNDQFTQINKISSHIINLDIPLNYLSEIEILNIKYNIFHQNTNFAFIQEKNSINLDYFYDVYIFDKRSYSIVGVIKTDIYDDYRLIACFEGKLLFLFGDYYKFYRIQNIRFPFFPDLSAYCKINPFKQAHLLSSPYLLPCGFSACLDCIFNHYNIFKRILMCPMCKKEHNLKFNQLKASDIDSLFNQDACTTISDKLKSSIHEIGRFLLFKFFSPL